MDKYKAREYPDYGSGSVTVERISIAQQIVVQNRMIIEQNNKILDRELNPPMAYMKPTGERK